jgi:long-chain acyl-CoA synthetase
MEVTDGSVRLAHEFLDRCADAMPDKVAVVDGSGRHTFGEIAADSVRAATWLQAHGVERGDRVLIVADNSASVVMWVFATLRAGGVFVVVNPTTKSDKLAFLIEDSGARAVVGGKSAARELVTALRSRAVANAVWLDEVPEGVDGVTAADALATAGDLREPGAIDADLAAIIYTSGSTGTAKGVMLTHRNIVHNAWSISTYLGLDADDVVICLLPLSFDYGLFQIFMGARLGFSVVLERSFAYPYDVLKRIAEARVTVLPGVPTIFASLLAMAPFDGLDLSALRVLTNTAAALPPSHIDRLREAFPGAQLFAMYGLTECTRVCYLEPSRLDDKVGSVGRAMPNTEVYVVDPEGRPVPPGVVGELVVRGASVMRGYWQRPRETDDWLRPGVNQGELVLHTHDRFRADEEGFLYFVGRSDDILKTKGEKVSPLEIETVLYELAEVKEVAVIGVHDEIDGTAIKAIIVPRSDAQVDVRAIRNHCRARLENYMVPKYIELSDELPKTESGKIRRASLT